MQLLGKNLANQKKLLARKLTVDLAINYLVAYFTYNHHLSLDSNA
jgi:hypothetical protein